MTQVVIEDIQQVIEVAAPPAPTVISAGPQGPMGPGNVFVQQTAPVASGGFLWLEVDGSGNLVDVWVNT